MVSLVGLYQMRFHDVVNFFGSADIFYDSTTLLYEAQCLPIQNVVADCH